MTSIDDDDDGPRGRRTVGSGMVAYGGGVRLRKIASSGKRLGTRRTVHGRVPVDRAISP